MPNEASNPGAIEKKRARRGRGAQEDVSTEWNVTWVREARKLAGCAATHCGVTDPDDVLVAAN